MKVSTKKSRGATAAVDHNKPPIEYLGVKCKASNSSKSRHRHQQQNEQLKTNLWNGGTYDEEEDSYENNDESYDNFDTNGDNFDTNNGDFQLISPTSTISAPSKFIVRSMEEYEELKKMQKQWSKNKKIERKNLQKKMKKLNKKNKKKNSIVSGGGVFRNNTPQQQQQQSHQKQQQYQNSQSQQRQRGRPTYKRHSDVAAEHAPPLQQQQEEQKLVIDPSAPTKSGFVAGTKSYDNSHQLRNARYRGAKENFHHIANINAGGNTNSNYNNSSSNEARSSSSKMMSRKEKMKLRAEQLKSCFTGCMEESAHKLDKLKLQAEPTIEKIKNCVVNDGNDNYKQAVTIIKPTDMTTTQQQQQQQQQQDEAKTTKSVLQSDMYFDNDHMDGASTVQGHRMSMSDIVDIHRQEEEEEDSKNDNDDYKDVEEDQDDDYEAKLDSGTCSSPAGNYNYSLAVDDTIVNAADDTILTSSVLLQSNEKPSVAAAKKNSRIITEQKQQNIDSADISTKISSTSYTAASSCMNTAVADGQTITASVRDSANLTVVPTPVAHLDDQFEAEARVNEEDDYFNRLETRDNAPPTPQSQDASSSSSSSSEPSSPDDTIENKIKMSATPATPLFPHESILQNRVDDDGCSNTDTDVPVETSDRVTSTNHDFGAKTKSKNGQEKPSTVQAKIAQIATPVREEAKRFSAESKQQHSLPIISQEKYEVDDEWLRVTPMLNKQPLPMTNASRNKRQSTGLGGLLGGIFKSRSTDTYDTYNYDDGLMDLRVTESAPSALETAMSSQHHLAQKQEGLNRATMYKSADECDNVMVAATKTNKNSESCAHQNSIHMSKQESMSEGGKAVSEKRVRSENKKAKGKSQRTVTLKKEDATPKRDLKHPYDPAPKMERSTIFSPMNDSVISTGSQASPLVSNQATSNADFLFNSNHKPARRPNASATPLSISTFASRCRLTDVSSRSRPTFSIPKSLSEAASLAEEANVARIEKTRSYGDEEDYEYVPPAIKQTFIKKAPSKDISEKSVRFSNDNDVKVINNVSDDKDYEAGADHNNTPAAAETPREETPRDIIADDIERKISDLTDADAWSVSTKSTCDSRRQSGEAVTADVKLLGEVLENDDDDAESKSIDKSKRDDETVASTETNMVKRWAYHESADGKQSSVTPVLGKKGSSLPTTSPMRRFRAAKSKFSNNNQVIETKKSVPYKKRSPIKIRRTGVKSSLVSNRITEIDDRLERTKQTTMSKNPRRLEAKSASNLITNKVGNPLVVRNPVIYRKSQSNALQGIDKLRIGSSTVRERDGEEYSGEQASELSGVLNSQNETSYQADDTSDSQFDATVSDTTASDSFFVQLRSTDLQEGNETATASFLGPLLSGLTPEDEPHESDSESDEEEDIFAGIMNNHSADLSEVPSVATQLRDPNRRLPRRSSMQSNRHSVEPSVGVSSVYDKENDEYDTDSLAISQIPSFGSRACVKPVDQHRHSSVAPHDPKDLCLSPKQKTPLQARKWRELAASAKEKKKNKNRIFKEKSRNCAY